MIIFHESYDGTKGAVHLKFVKYIPILNGNRDFMTI